MLLRAKTRFKTLPLKPYPHFQSQPLYLSTSLNPSNDAVSNLISKLLKTANWQSNPKLKTLTSHLNPNSASQILATHIQNPPLCLKFFKWVSQNSTYCHSLPSQIQILTSLSSSQLSFPILHKLLILLIKDCSFCPDKVSILIRGVDTMRVESGFRVNYTYYSSLLICLARVDMGLVGFKVFVEMSREGFEPGRIDYRSVVNGLCKGGFVKGGEMFVCRAVKVGFGIDVYVYASLVLGYCRVRDIGEAFRVFGLMSDCCCGVNSVTYTILVHGLCEVGKLEEACRLKEEMSEKGCWPSTRTYTVLIKGMCDRGLVGRAFGLFDEMVEKGCKPNLYTYTVLVDVLCREGRIEEGNGIFRKMLKDGLSPGTVTYNALINGYCKEGRVVCGFELLGVMERRQCKPNIRTYNELMEGLCKVDKPYKALALLRKVVDNGLIPSEITFNILVNGFCKAGEISMALEILQCMRSIGVEPDRFSYTAFVDRFCKMERVEQAGVFVGLMMKKGISLDEVALTSLIHGYCKIGEIKYAISLFEGIVDNMSLTSPHTFNVFLDVFIKQSKLSEGNAILGKMVKYGIVPSVVTHTILVDGVRRTGDKNSSSLKMLEIMKQDNCPPNIYTYTIAINSLCQSRSFQEAKNLLIEMRKAEISPNANIYTYLITGLCGTGRIAEVDSLVQEMVESGLTPDSDICACIISYYCKNRDYDCCLEWITRFIGYGCVGDLACYGDVIVGLQNEGRLEEADGLISEMVRNVGVEDQVSIGSYIDFLVEGDEPCLGSEVLNLIEQMCHKEKP